MPPISKPKTFSFFFFSSSSTIIIISPQPQFTTGCTSFPFSLDPYRFLWDLQPARKQAGKTSSHLLPRETWSCFLGNGITISGFCCRFDFRKRTAAEWVFGRLGFLAGSRQIYSMGGWELVGSGKNRWKWGHKKPMEIFTWGGCRFSVSYWRDGELMLKCLWLQDFESFVVWTFHLKVLLFEGVVWSFWLYECFAFRF